jgi:N-acetylmuramoyl-L-alanine amidase
MDKLKICLDAGHGMYTAGKRSPDGIREAVQNYGVMYELSSILQSCGFEVVYTNKDKYTDMSLTSRVRIANISKANLFVSLHSNAIGNEWQDKASGIETFVYGFGGQAEVVARDVQAQLIKDTAMKDRGVKVGNFQVLRDTVMPAMLLELGFMDNKIESTHMKDPVWHKKYANAIAKGICSYYKVPFKTTDALPFKTTDVPTVTASWKTDPIQELLDKGILTSDDWLSKSDAPVTNWQMAIMLNRTIEYIKNSKNS